MPERNGRGRKEGDIPVSDEYPRISSRVTHRSDVEVTRHSDYGFCSGRSPYSGLDMWPGKNWLSEGLSGKWGEDSPGWETPQATTTSAVCSDSWALVRSEGAKEIASFNINHAARAYPGDTG